MARSFVETLCSSVQRLTSNEPERVVVDPEASMTSVLAHRSTYNETYEEYWQAHWWHTDSSYREKVEGTFPRSHAIWDLKTEQERAKFFNQTAEGLIENIRTLSIEVIRNRWEELTPFERRVLDVAASSGFRLYPGSGYSKDSFAAEDVLQGIFSEDRIVEETGYVSEKFARDDISPILHRKLFLYHFENEAQKIYGGQKVDSEKDIGTRVFVLQRALSQMSPLILAKLFESVPEENTINRSAIISYFGEVIAQSRARTINHDGIELTINPHVTEPYTDEEWETALDEQLTAAPKIAQKIVDSCPGVLAVTLYGPLTREDKDYVMFHPREGIQLGAFFSEKNSGASDLAKKVGEEYGVAVKTGTAHGGVFGGSFSGWAFCNELRLNELEREIFSSRGDSIFSPLYLDHLAEMVFQVLHGDTLAVSDKRKFKRVTRRLECLSDQHLSPIFDQSQKLHQHFENGYPHPIEYKGYKEERRNLLSRFR